MKICLLLLLLLITIGLLEAVIKYQPLIDDITYLVSELTKWYRIAYCTAINNSNNERICMARSEKSSDVLLAQTGK